jgi:hypothetical protein
MILLIDDNISNQQEQYGCSFIKEGVYETILTHLTGIRTPERADFLERLPDKTAAIFFHATSKDIDSSGELISATETISKIYHQVKEKQIRYVRFSWGHTSDEAILNSGNIDSMNKRIFYLNLKDFLDDFTENGEMDFKIVHKGIGYRKEALIEEAEMLINNISKLESLTFYDLSQKEINQQLEGYLRTSKSLLSIDQFNAKYSRTITYSGLIELIQKSMLSIRRYGKNVYY